MKKKFLLTLILIVLSILAFSATSTSAGTHGDLTYSISGGEVTITDCSETATGDIVIPDTIENYPVTSIGSRAFYNCTQITGITIPETVVTVGYYAFQNCTSLESVYWNATINDLYQYSALFYNAGNAEKGMNVYFGDSVTSIPAYLFSGEANDMGTIYSNSPKVMTVEFGKNVKKIGSYAFGNCKYLESVHIPQNITTIYPDAFFGCSGLKVITVDEENTNYFSDDYGVLYDKKQELLYVYPSASDNTSYTIPKTVYEICDRAFYNADKLCEIKIVGNLATVGDDAFYGCGASASDLSLFIGKAVTKIPYTLYSKQNNLSIITVEEGNTSFTAQSNVLYDIGKTKLLRYAPKKADTKFEIPDTVQTVGDYAVAYCNNLTELVLSENISSVGTYAFAGCSNVNRILWEAPKLSMTPVYGDMGSYWYTSFSGVGSSTDGLTVIFTDTVLSIPKDAFKNNSSLKSVSIGKNVNRIAENAFYGTEIYNDTSNWHDGFLYYDGCILDSNPASSIYNYEVMPGTRIIANNVFYNISSLQKVVLPEGLTSIGDYAFWNCNGLKYINIPSSVVYVGNGAFYNVRLDEVNLHNTESYFNIDFGSDAWDPAENATAILENGQPVTKLVFRNNISTIPSYIKKLSTVEELVIEGAVTRIEAQTFENFVSLKKVTIGGDITSIGSQAFYGCSAITELTLGDNITTIETQAFYGCSAITDLTLGDNVTTIENQAFYGCSAITELTLGDNITTIGSQAFSGCHSIRNFTCNSNKINNSGYDVFQNSGVDGVDVILGDNVETYPGSLINSFTNINSVTFGTGIKSIEYNAFYNKNINAVYVPDIKTWLNIEFENENANPFYSTSNVYVGGELLTNLIIPDEVTEIKPYAFINCKSLKSVTVPENVESVGSRAFEGCVNIERLEWNAVSVSDFPEEYSVFGGIGSECGGTELVFGESVTKIPAYFMCQENYWDSSSCVINNITFGQNITEIGDYAFYYEFNTLKSIDLPDSLCKIGDYALYRFENIESIELPETLCEIGKGAFEEWENLENVIINNVDNWCKIDYHSSNHKLYEAVKTFMKNGEKDVRIFISDDVQKVPDFAFYNCSDILTVSLGNRITSIGSSAFSMCSSLLRVKLSDNLKTIGNSAFADCVSINSITIPSTVTNIGRYAFEDCERLTSVYISDMASWCNIKFGGLEANPIGYNTKLFCGDEPVTHVTIPDYMTAINPYTFHRYKYLESVTVPESIKSVGVYAFAECTNLETVNISSLENWCGFDFQNDYENPLYYASKLYVNGELLEDLVIPETVTSVKNAQFCKLDCLKSVTLHDGIKTVENYAFDECVNLRYAVIPKGMTYIKNDAFRNCSNLSNVFFRGNADEWNDILIYDDNSCLENAQFTFDATPKTYTFVTNCDQSIAPLTTYCISSSPSVSNGEYSINGWYDNPELAGDCISFPYCGDAEILYASWTDGSDTSFDDGYSGTKTVCITAVTGEKIFTCIPSNLPLDSLIILACYDGEKLVEVMHTPNTNETVNFVSKKAFDCAKVMVWESLTSLKPVIEAEVVK